MDRPLWKGVISFGLVSIPVKLYVGTAEKDISFHLIHAECKSRIQLQRWCPVHEHALVMPEIERAYEYAKDRYVVVTDEDLERLPVPSKHIINLSAFVKADQVDPVFYQKSYYIEPDEMGKKPYALLIRALRERSLIGIAKLTIRTRERLCAIRATTTGTLMLETLFYDDEVRVPREAESPDIKVSQPELTMAFNLVDLLTESFQPEKYRDEYREALLATIDAKLQGKEVVAPPPAAPAKVIDLMSALRESVEAAKKRRQPGAPRAVEQKSRQAS